MAAASSESSSCGPGPGPLVQLNTRRTLLDGLGLATLDRLVAFLIMRLQTAVSVYEANGDYAGVCHASPWCRLLNEASRRQCGAEEPREALDSGRWTCHESRWSDAARRSIEGDTIVDVPCAGGMRVRALPLHSHGQVIGGLSLCYGAAPTDPAQLQELSARFGVPVEELKVAAEASQAQRSELKEVADSARFAAYLLEQLIEQKQDAAELEELRERFLGIVSHDLRAPLTAARLGSDMLLKRGHLQEQDAETVGRIGRSARRMASMVDQLFDFTRIRHAGGFQLNVRHFDLELACRELVAEAELANPGRHLDVEARGNTELEGDEDRLAQVVSNLLGNALRYGLPERPIEVKLEGNGPALVLTIHNEGPPIPPAVLPVLFDPFHQLKQRAVTNRQREGLGLGLFIVREIVAAHRGTVTVQSKDGEGTTFTIRLPRSVASCGETP